MCRRLSRAGAVALSAALLVGCRSVAGGDAVCTGEAVPGIRIDVLDSASRAPAGRDTRVIARDGAHADTARRFAPHGFQGELRTFTLAVGRRGTYEVTVEHPVYRLWRRPGVRAA